MIVGEIGAGTSIDALLADYPYLERADVMQALRYAAWRVQGRDESRPYMDTQCNDHLSPAMFAGSDGIPA